MQSQGAESIFSQAATAERWLRFEIALAEIEAMYAIVPASAAAAIAAVKITDLDLNLIREETEEVRHPLVPFVRALSAAAGPAGEYVHWGATSQDVLDTGKMLAIQEADRSMTYEVQRLLSALVVLADRHRTTLMPGRTAGQFATPITFGVKVAGWIDELLRESLAFDAVRDLVFVGELGGTTGGLGMFGAIGPTIRDELCAKLGLHTPSSSWHTSRDRFVRWAFHCVMVASVLGRISSEIMHLQRSEIAEVAEPFGASQVGSSAMAHKRNPTITPNLMAKVAMIEAEFGAALSTWRGLHERDKSQFGVEDEYLPSISMRTLEQIPKLTQVIEGLSVDEAAMRLNLERDGRSVWSEALLYKVAETHGRTTAHELIHRASTAWRPGRDLPSILAADPEMTSVIVPSDVPDPATVDRILDASAAIIDRVIDETRQYVKDQQ